MINNSGIVNKHMLFICILWFACFKKVSPKKTKQNGGGRHNGHARMKEQNETQKHNNVYKTSFAVVSKLVTFNCCTFRYIY